MQHIAAAKPEGMERQQHLTADVWHDHHDDQMRGLWDTLQPYIFRSAIKFLDVLLSLAYR